MFNSVDTIIRSLTNKISELQKQLGKKEKEIRQLDNEKVMLLNNSMKLLKEKDDKLDSQPVEIAEKIKKFIHTGEYDDFGNEYLMSGSSVLEFLDEFLKEYQK